MVGNHCPGKYLASPSFGVIVVTNSLLHARYPTCIIIFDLEESSVCCVCMLSQFRCIWLLVTLWTIAHRLLCPCDSPGKSTGVGCHFLLQGIFPTHTGSNPCLLRLLHWHKGSLLLAPPGNPNLLNRCNTYSAAALHYPEGREEHWFIATEKLVVREGWGNLGSPTTSSGFPALSMCLWAKLHCLSSVLKAPCLESDIGMPFLVALCVAGFMMRKWYKKTWVEGGREDRRNRDRK